MLRLKADHKRARTIDRKGDPKVPYREVFHAHDSIVAVQRLLQCATIMHRHEFTELVIIVDGSGLHTVDDMSYCISPGDFFVISGKHRHAYSEPRQLQLVNVLITNAFIKKHRVALEQIRGGLHLFGKAFTRPRCLPPEELGNCLRLVERLQEEIRGAEEGRSTMLSALLLELLVTLSRRVTVPARIEDFNRMHIREALSFIEKNSSQDIGLKEMAAAARMSPRSFQRHFKATAGIAPMKYLQHQRIANCCRLLRETSAPIHVIAADCGIHEPAYFSRLFRQVTGTTPGAFRARTPLA